MVHRRFRTNLIKWQSERKPWQRRNLKRNEVNNFFFRAAENVGMKNGRGSSPASVSMCSRRRTQCCWTVIRWRVWCSCKNALLDKLDKTSLSAAISASRLCAFSQCEIVLATQHVVKFDELLHQCRQARRSRNLCHWSSRQQTSSNRRPPFPCA